MDNIFGTDGIRGVFGAELNCGSAYLWGRHCAERTETLPS